MNGEETTRILNQVTAEILGRLRDNGFHVRYDNGNALDELRFDPLVWDINNGYCEQWADLAAERIGEGAFATWIDPEHCVLVYDGRFYDADCTKGKRHWNQLPMFADPAHERPEP